MCGVGEVFCSSHDLSARKPTTWRKVTRFEALCQDSSRRLWGNPSSDPSTWLALARLEGYGLCLNRGPDLLYTQRSCGHFSCQVWRLAPATGVRAGEDMRGHPSRPSFDHEEAEAQSETWGAHGAPAGYSSERVCASGPAAPSWTSERGRGTAWDPRVASHPLATGCPLSHHPQVHRCAGHSPPHPSRLHLLVCSVVSGEIPLPGH